MLHVKSVTTPNRTRIECERLCEQHDEKTINVMMGVNETEAVDGGSEAPR